MAKTFAEELKDARARMTGNNLHMDVETDRVHREATKDGHHAYRNVEHRTKLTL